MSKPSLKTLTEFYTHQDFTVETIKFDFGKEYIAVDYVRKESPVYYWNGLEWRQTGLQSADVPVGANNEWLKDNFGYILYPEGY